MKNWIRFFHKVDVDEAEASSFYDYISNFKSGAYLSFNEIKNHCNLTIGQAKQLINEGINTELLTPLKSCPHCGDVLFERMFEIKNLKEVHNCKSCELEVNTYEVTLFAVTKKASKISEKEKQLEEHSYETNAELLSSIGAQQGYLFYLLTDITGSENLQRADTEKYSSYLSFLWEDYWPKLLRVCEKIYLPLLAKGDAVAIVYSDLFDAISTINKMKSELPEEGDLNLSVTLSKISFSSKDRKGFLRSLDKKWDLNTEGVTATYRGASHIKPKIWEIEKKFRIKLLVLDELATELFDRISEFKEMEYSESEYTDKHKIKHNRKYLGGVI